MTIRLMDIIDISIDITRPLPSSLPTPAWDWYLPILTSRCLSCLSSLSSAEYEDKNDVMFAWLCIISDLGVSSEQMMIVEMR